MKSRLKYTFPFFETIGLWSSGFPYLSYHQKRVNRTFHHFYSTQEPHQLKDVLKLIEPRDTVHKVRFFYNADSFEIEVLPSKPRIVEHWKRVNADDLDYAFKWQERSFFKEYSKKNPAGDCLIFKNGLLTDSLYANVVVLHKGQMYTPSEPLLKGIMRDYLIENKKILPAAIDEKFLLSSEGFLCINALNPIETAPFYPICRIG